MITYKTRAQRFLDDFEAAGLRELLDAIQSRLDKLEAAHSPSQEPTSPSIPKRKRGRPKRNLEQMMQNPKVAALHQALQGMAGVPAKA